MLLEFRFWIRNVDGRRVLELELWGVIDPTIDHTSIIRSIDRSTHRLTSIRLRFEFAAQFWLLLLQIWFI